MADLSCWGGIQRVVYVLVVNTLHDLGEGGDGDAC
jgi:hypothetical protein